MRKAFDKSSVGTQTSNRDRQMNSTLMMDQGPIPPAPPGPNHYEHFHLDLRKSGAIPVMKGLDSSPQTPIEQTPPPPGHNPYGNSSAFGSVSSIATTDDEDANNEILYPWTEQQSLLVRSVYEEITNRPETTPFSGRHLPSGVLHRVAKDTLRIARHKKVYFPHSMNAVRHHVIELYNATPETSEELQRYPVPGDYFSQMGSNGGLSQPFVPRQPIFTSLSSQPYGHTASELSTDCLVNQADERELLVDEEFEFSNTSGNPDRSAFEKYSSTRVQPVVSRENILAGPAQLSTSQSVSSQTSQHTNAQSNLRSSLLGPDCAKMLTEEDVVNIVAKRKRDSMRMKRGQLF